MKFYKFYCSSADEPIIDTFVIEAQTITNALKILAERLLDTDYNFFDICPFYDYGCYRRNFTQVHFDFLEGELI